MKIAYLYYDFLNLYGESGNIKIISQILKMNKIKHEILCLSLDDELEFDKYDLVYIGSGTEDNLKIVLQHLMKYQQDIAKYVENNKFMLLTGNSMDIFGKSIEGEKALNIFDYEVNKIKRVMEEVYIDSDITKNKIIGFRNGCYELEYNKNPLFESEGYLYKNAYLTHIIGPVLVRNPEFLKYFLNKLTNQKLKYDLKLEIKAYETFVKNFKEVV